MLLGLGGAVPIFVTAAALAITALVILAIFDLAIGPRRSDIHIERVNPDPFALRARGALEYTIANRSNVAIDGSIIEAPCSKLEYDEDEIAFSLPPLSEARLTRPVTPIARGSTQLQTVYLKLRNAIGIFERRSSIIAPALVRVYPDLSAVERYGALHVRNRIVEAGLRRMRLRGTGTELENLREWTPGDQFRSIEWKATARRGRLMVAEYEVERSQNVMILLDAGRLMTAYVEGQRKFDFAITAALSLASIAALAKDKIGVVTFAGKILRAFAPRSSTRSLAAIAEKIHDVEPFFEESDYGLAFAYVRTHVQKRSLIVFFTDMVDPVAQAAVLSEIGSLSKRHLVICVFMNDRAIDRAVDAEPHSAADVYATSVALELRDERRTAAAMLVRLGVQVIDVPAAELTTALIDRYLLVKQRGLL